MRNMVPILVALLAGSLAASSVCAQQMYRWVDKDGKVHYTQTPPPPGAAKSVQSRVTPGAAAGASTLPFVTQLAAKNYPVTLYTSPECAEPCKEARDLLAKRGVPHRAVEVSDQKTFDELKRATGSNSVPVMLVGTAMEKGFEESRYHAALDAAGYPREGPPLAAPAPAAAPPKPAAPRAVTAAQEEAPAGEPVQLFTSPECGSPCKEARALLAQRGISVKEIATDDPQGFDELQRVSGGTLVPVMVIGNNVLRGFEPTQYNAALDAAGYGRGPR